MRFQTGAKHRTGFDLKIFMANREIHGKQIRWSGGEYAPHMLFSPAELL